MFTTATLMSRPDDLDVKNFPEVDPPDWDPVILPDDNSAKSALFRRRVKAMRAMVGRGQSSREVGEAFRFRERELFRLRKRCLTVREDGMPYGYEALWPGRRLVAYTRRTANPIGGGGQLTQLFERYPQIQKEVVDAFLGRKRKGKARERQMRFVAVWRVFLEACEQASVARDAYPYTSRDSGREALRRFCKRLHKHGLFRAYVHGRHGENAARVADAASDGRVRGRTLRPYEWVQLDGHRLDAIATVEVVDWQGVARDLVLERCWLIVVIDVASRAILGYTISLLRNYSSEDVQDAIAHALTPWKPKPTVRTRVPYQQGAGLPSGVIPGCGWRAFDRISFDNAFAQQSFATQKQIIATVFSSTNTNPPAKPIAHAVVERVFGTITQWLSQRLPSTVGSGPRDTRKHKPAEAAQKYRIRFEDLEELIDVTIANYNAQPHKGLDGLSPMQFIRRSMASRSALVRHIVPPHQQHMPIHNRSFARVVRGSVDRGIRPYVEFLGVRYRNQALAIASERIGEKVQLVVNTKDIRTVQAYDENGLFIGQLSAPDIWMQRPHSIRTRRAILAYMRSATMARDSVSPIDSYFTELDRRLTRNAKARNERLRLKRESGGDAKSEATIDGQSSRSALHQRSWVAIHRTLN